MITNFLNLLDKKNYLTVDVETTTKNKGNPFTLDNKLVSTHLKLYNYRTLAYFEPHPDVLKALKTTDLAIGFNIKFDLHWLRKVYDVVPERVWDCQLAEFILGNQLHPYPSLNETALSYGLGTKVDKVKELWDQGIDTDAIDKDLLTEYGNHDVDLTYAVFLKQLERFKEKPQQFLLFRLHCNDLLVLQEMEWNGVIYDCEASIQHANSILEKVKDIENFLYQMVDGIPINFNSNDHKSVLLYGGTITNEYRLPIGVYKTGAKVGQQRFKVHQQIFTLPRLVEPLKGSELAKEGMWSTDEPTLLSLKANKTTKIIIDKLLERAGLVKLISTYLTGIPKLIDKMEWPINTIHCNLNQCVAITGRLSSTKPNMQNQPYEVKQFCVSRYDNLS